ncbi:hypothetical protein ACHAQJ_005858 [Trichoderma viride]
MSKRFPSISISLMVGIGSGVPSEKHDIRLGDVVVGTTQNGDSAVFQYDFAKTIQHQEFQNTFNINPRLRTKYKRPHPRTDRLYRNIIVPPSTSNRNGAKTRGDDQLVLVSRTQQVDDGDEDAVRVHYGLIASSSQLVKDARIRDQLTLQKDVLCFAMEAAGLMSPFPCLVIRGICDYADSYKNKVWQVYAAISAAAYARDILKQIPPIDIIKKRAFDDDVALG